MKCVFQLVRRSDGSRNDAILIERDVFARDLKDKFPRALYDDYYVLVLYESNAKFGLLDKTKFSNYPLLSVGSFVQLYGGRMIPTLEQPEVIPSIAKRLSKMFAGDNRKE